MISLIALTATLRAEENAAGIRSLSPQDEVLFRRQVDRDAIRSSHFAMMEAAGTKPTPEPAPVETVSITVAMQALGELTDGLAYPGTVAGLPEPPGGSVEFWLRAARDRGEMGVCLGKSLQVLGGSLPPHPIKDSLLDLAKQLTSLHWTGSGEAAYWRLKTQSLSETITTVGAALKELARKADPGELTVPLAHVLDAIGHTLQRATTDGEGHADFWMAACQDFVLIAWSAGRSLKRITPAVPAAPGYALKAVAAQLASLSSSGSGNVNFWLARAVDLSEKIVSRGVRIVQIGQQPPSPARRGGRSSRPERFVVFLPDDVTL